MEKYIPTFFITYELASKEVHEARNDICRSCDHLKENDVCDLCHCKVFFKNEFIETKCPLGKWE